MKTLAIMGSGNGGNFEAIAKYLKNRKDIKITCISDKKDALILEKAKNLGIEHRYLPFKENEEYFSKNKFDLIVLAGYMRIIPDVVLKEMGKVINIHPSLLPSFKGKNAIQQAFLAGVKVTGVTIHEVDSTLDGGKIIAQYPVFVTQGTHLDELEEEIHTIEHKLYPIVVEKVLDDKVFDFQDLMRGSSNCGGKCGGNCSGGH